ncbi:MAG: hypothetical protein SFX72_20200 [Isosphaeraceae bacterium]|nr:hypothetical protein [Isosphaeraceae bacterium]
MPCTLAGRRAPRRRGLLAFLIAVSTIFAVVGSARAQDLIPPPSAKPSGPPPAAGADDLPPIPSLPPTAGNEAPPAFAGSPTPTPAAAPPAAPAAAPVPAQPAPDAPPANSPPGLPAALEPTAPAPQAPPAGMRRLPRSNEATDAPLDGEVRPSNAPNAETGPLPGAADPPPGAAPAVAAQGAAGETPDGFMMPADRLPIGRQAVGLSIEVVAPQVMNINHPAVIKLIVRNTGNTDVSTARVRYELPKELSLLESRPEANRASADDPLLHFMLNTLAAGSERIISLRVKANAVASIDHAARVYVLAGSRARTVIQQPILKVEMPDPTPSKVLKGKQTQFRIAVKNDGNGPARDVEVTAKFSAGLKVDENDVVGQVIPIIQPGERIELDPLLVDTYAGGEQTCKVIVSSPDVAASPNDMTITRSIIVTKPELTLELKGPPKRFTDTLADYTLTLQNPGTAAAKNITITAILPPSGGRLVAIPAGAQWIKESRRLSWVIPNLEPNERATMGFQVRLGGMGLYQVTAEGRSADMLDKESFSTDVSGFPDVRLEISERRRVLDVGEFTVFDITVVNSGTRDATNVRLSAFLATNLEPSNYAVEGLELDADPPWNEKTGEIRFPALERLAPNRPIKLSIKAKAKDAGVGTCRVFLEHDDLAGVKLEQFAHTTVAGGPSQIK